MEGEAAGSFRLSTVYTEWGWISPRQCQAWSKSAMVCGKVRFFEVPLRTAIQPPMDKHNATKKNSHENRKLNPIVQNL